MISLRQKSIVINLDGKDANECAWHLEETCKSLVDILFLLSYNYVQKNEDFHSLSTSLSVFSRAIEQL